MPTLDATDATLQAAFAAHQAGQFPEAERLYRQVLDRHPRNFPALRFLGVIAGHAGRWQAGIKLLRDALKVEPRSAEAHTDLGALQHARRDLDGAADSFAAALRFDPGYPNAHHNLGIVRRDQGRFAEAAASFGAALGLKPDFIEAWYNLGIAWQASGFNDHAVFAYRRAVSLNGKRLDIRCALGGLLFEMADYPAASEAYRAALDIDPTFANALNGYAAARGQVGGEDAIDVIRHAIETVPNNIYGYDLLGNLMRRHGRFDDAIAAFEAAIRLPGNHAHSYYGLTHAKKLRSDDRSLIAGITAELASAGAGLSASDRSYMHFAMGKACDDLDLCETAIKHYDLANKAWLDARPPNRRAADPTLERRRNELEFNTLIAGFGAADIARLQRWGSDTEKPILIVGMMRSGTTLVEQVLASHPDVAAGGELTFWSECRLRFGLGTGAVLHEPGVAESVRSYERLLDGIGGSASRVTDKMPHNFLLLGMIHGLFPNARIIHCRRHPVDTSLSIYFTRFAREQDFAYDRSSIVFFYKAYRRLMAHWHRVIPQDRLITIDYEALVADQENVTRRLLDFCGLAWSDSCLSFHDTDRPVRTASAWQVRQPLYRTSAARWRRYEPWLGEFRELLDVPHVDGESSSSKACRSPLHDLPGHPEKSSNSNHLDAGP